MAIAITKEDIPLKLLSDGSIDVDIERLNINFSRAAKIPRGTTLPVVESAVRDSNFPIKNINGTEEAVRDVVRLLKTYARPVLLRYGLEDNGIMIINPKDYYDKNDIVASYTFTSYLNSNSPGRPFIDITRVAFALIEHGFLDEDERAKFGDDVSSYVVNHKNWSYAHLTGNRLVFEERVREIAESFIDNFIFSRWYVRYLEKISDTVSAPYFKVDEDLSIGLASNDKLTSLLIALGYATIEDLSSDKPSEFEKILEMLTTHVQQNALETFPDDEVEDNLDEINRLVNLNFLNALYINALDGKKTHKTFDVGLSHNIVFSQAEIEEYFLETAVGIIRPDAIREALHSMTGLPMSALQDITDQIHETMVDVFLTAMKEDYTEPYTIFNKVLQTLHIELQAFIKTLE